MLKLYDFGPSRGVRVRWTLAELGVDYESVTVNIVASGHFKAADRLQLPSTATTVRIRDGKTLITDGPFANTKEVFGGYYLYEADDLDQATEMAARIPAVRLGGSIEIRPVMGKSS